MKIVVPRAKNRSATERKYQGKGRVSLHHRKSYTVKLDLLSWMNFINVIILREISTKQEELNNLTSEVNQQKILYEMVIV